MLWDDPYRWPNTSLAQDTIVTPPPSPSYGSVLTAHPQCRQVQAYRAKDACARAADDGHDVVVSPMGVYYLRSEGATWDRLYEWEPYDYCQATGNATRQAHVLGGWVPGRQHLNLFSSSC